MKEMNIYISKPDGLASFGDIFFSEDEAEDMAKFAKKLGYKVSLVKTDRRFSNDNSPFRKIMVRDIDWSDYNNILYVIDNRDKTDDEICRGLKSEGSGFSITIKRGQIMTCYANMVDKLNGHPTKQAIINMAKLIAGKFISGRVGIENNIDNMTNKGCTVSKKSGFPECITGFNKNCFVCPHNKVNGNMIKTDADIVRYNNVFMNMEME